MLCNCRFIIVYLLLPQFCSVRLDTQCSADKVRPHNSAVADAGEVTRTRARALAQNNAGAGAGMLGGSGRLRAGKNSLRIS